MATNSFKFLQRLAKRGKGAIDMDEAPDLLSLVGFEVEPTIVSIDLAKHTDGDSLIKALLGPWAEKHNLRSVREPKYSDNKKWNLRLDESRPHDTQVAVDDLMNYVQIVDTAPPDPDIGTLYMTRPSAATRHDVAVDRAWLGGRGWTITAPSGKSTTVNSPVIRRTGLPTSGPLNLAPLWTFLYKNGAAEAAKAKLAEAHPEEVAEATATKAERERIVRRRSSLPEIEALFMSVTDARYNEIVEWIRTRYIETVAAALKMQERGQGGAIWKSFPETARYLLKQEYQDDGSLRWVARKDYEEIARARAEAAAADARDAFVEKNTFRISEIARKKDMVPSAEILSIEPGPTFNSRMRFSFPDKSSFELRNKTIWKTSPLGVYFAQFPTTFHDVVLPTGKPMSKPSEARMLDVFAAPRNGSELERLAARVARGEAD